MQNSSILNNTEWGGILRLALPALLWILVFSIITLGLSSSYGHSVAHSRDNHSSTGTLVLYSGTMPLLTILSTLLTTSLHLASRLTHTTALAISTTFLIGWIIQVSFWMNCEFTGPGISESVPDYCPDVGPNGMGVGKLSMAWVVITGYLVHVGLAAYGLVKVRGEAKKGVVMKDVRGNEERAINY